MKKTFTYFVRSGDFVKIGRTSNLQSRIDQLRVAFPNPPILLNACDMPESAAHKIAGEITQRACGEWFNVNPALMSWIAGIEPTNDEGASFILKTRTPKKPQPPKGKRGAPKKQVTKSRIQICLDPAIHELAKKAAFAEGMALSTWIERLARQNMTTGGAQ